MARATLESCGFVVTHCRSAKAARAACLRSFEFYLVDVSVPASESGRAEGDGLAFVALVRAQAPTARVVVWSAEDHHAAAHALGVDFIRKDERAGTKLREFLKRGRLL